MGQHRRASVGRFSNRPYVKRIQPRADFVESDELRELGQAATVGLFYGV